MSENKEEAHAADALMSSAHLRERREVRYEVPIEIVASGITQNGEVFHERTFTRNVSEWGCGFLMPIELKPDDIVALRVASPDAPDFAHARQSLFQVVRVTREPAGWVIGAWKMDNDDVWGSNFPSASKAHPGSLNSRKEEPPQPRPHPTEDENR